MKVLRFCLLVCCFSVTAAEPLNLPSLTLSLCTELTKHADVTNVITRSTSEHVTRAGNQAGIRFQIERHAWKRCLQMAQDNKVDGVFALFWTPERSSYLAFPTGSESGQNAARLRIARYYFYENVERPLDINNLKYGIGAPLGYVVRDKLAAQGLLSPIDYSIKEGFVMLGRQKLDAYLIADQLGDSMIDALNQDEIVRKRQPAYLEQDLHVAFSEQIFNQHQQQIETFWAALESFRAEYQ